MNDLAALSMNSMSEIKILNNVTNNITVINSKQRGKNACKDKDEINARRRAIYAKNKDIQNAKRRANYSKKKGLTIKNNTNNCELDIKNAKRRANYAKKKI